MSLSGKGMDVLAGAVGKLQLLWSNLKAQTQFGGLILHLLQIEHMLQSF